MDPPRVMDVLWHFASVATCEGSHSVNQASPVLIRGVNGLLTLQIAKLLCAATADDDCVINCHRCVMSQDILSDPKTQSQKKCKLLRLGGGLISAGRLMGQHQCNGQQKCTYADADLVLQVLGLAAWHWVFPMPMCCACCQARQPWCA